MIKDSSPRAYMEFTETTQQQRLASVIGMATEVRVLPFQQKPAPGKPRGAQCPSCFTYNLLKHLPDNRKFSNAGGWELKCALCGDWYPLQSQAA